MLTIRNSPTVLQAILLTINGLSSFVFKSLVYLRMCEKILHFFLIKSRNNSIVESLAHGFCLGKSWKPIEIFIMYFNQIETGIEILIMLIVKLLLVLSIYLHTKDLVHINS